MITRIQLPGCDNANYYLLKVEKHKNFQCKCCRLQISLIAGTLSQGTHLALNIWFLVIYLISQAKTGLSALDLKRQLDVSYPTAWLIQQKLMQVVIERDALCGNVQTNDFYHRGELASGKAGLGSANKAPFVAAISLSAEGPPPNIKMAPVPGFTRKAVFDWATVDLTPGFIVTSDGLGCFTGVTDAGCQHRAIVSDSRKSKELPEFNWINTVLANLKTSLGGAYHAFDFAKYETRYLGVFVYRFNRRFHL